MPTRHLWQWLIAKENAWASFDDPNAERDDPPEHVPRRIARISRGNMSAESLRAVESYVTVGDRGRDQDAEDDNKHRHAAGDRGEECRGNYDPRSFRLIDFVPAVW